MSQILTLSLFIDILLGNIPIIVYISYSLSVSLCIYPTGSDLLGNANTCLISQFSPARSHTRFPLCCLSLGSTRQTGFWLLQFQNFPPQASRSSPFLMQNNSLLPICIQLSLTRQKQTKILVNLQVFYNKFILLSESENSEIQQLSRGKFSSAQSQY